MLYNSIKHDNGGDIIQNDSFFHNVEIAHLAGVYKDLAELIGYENAFIIFHNMKGQQVTFPKRLFTKDFTDSQILSLYNGKNVKTLAKKFNYTECHVYRILKKHKNAEL
jgi:Mor family transcriptional regulator